MRKFRRILIYSIAGSFVLTLYLTLVTLKENVEEDIRKGRYIKKELVNLDEDGPENEIDKENEIERENELEKEKEENSGNQELEDDPLDENVTKLLREVESENNIRIQRIEEACKKYSVGIYKKPDLPTLVHPPVPQYSVFYFDKPNKLSFCPIYKAGSSTWLYNLLLLSGMNEEEIKNSGKQLSVIARERYPELEPTMAEEAFQKTIKILTVRHPFERILSAYRDKLENTNHGREHGTLHFYHKYGSKIVKKYRKNGNNTKSWELLKPSQYLWNPDHEKPAGIEPTFQEFVKYLIDTNLALYSDDHWIPYYLYCTPCLLRYDIIGKVETLNQDQLFAIRVLGLQDKIKPRWQHKTQFTGDDPKNKNTVSQVAKVYFNQLSVEEIQNLHEKYKFDFDLFDYDYSQYLNYAYDFDR